MKTLMTVLVVVIFMTGCQREPTPDTAEFDSAVGQLLRGEHQLLPMLKVREVTSGHSGEYVLIQSPQHDPKSFILTFAWRAKTGMITFTEVPLESVRVQFDDEVRAPSIRFKWRSGTQVNQSDMNGVVHGYVLFSVLTCAYDVWPRSLKYPTPIYKKHETP